MDETKKDDEKNLNNNSTTSSAVTNIQHGLTKQHFINISFGLEKKGTLFKQQLLQDDWNPPPEKVETK